MDRKARLLRYACSDSERRREFGGEIIETDEALTEAERNRKQNPSPEAVEESLCPYQYPALQVWEK